MGDQADRAREFTALHVKGDPVVIYNVWDGGSARAVAAAGAKAIATGDHPVGFAHGFTNDDFGGFTFDVYLGTIREIASRIGSLPFSVDISTAADTDASGLRDRIRTLLDVGVVGINFEDRNEDGPGVVPAAQHAERIAAVRETAESVGVPIHVNARTDVFSTAGDTPPADLLDEAVERGRVYLEAGASSLFTPRLLDLDVIRQLTERVALPVNIIRLPGAPSTRELADAGVARVSYGPVPQMQTMAWLQEQAKTALTAQI